MAHPKRLAEERLRLIEQLQFQTGQPLSTQPTPESGKARHHCNVKIACIVDLVVEVARVGRVELGSLRPARLRLFPLRSEPERGGLAVVARGAVLCAVRADVDR